MGFMNGFRDWNTGYDLNESKLNWVRTNVLGFEQIVLKGSSFLEGVEHSTSRVNHSYPNIVKSVARLVYSPSVEMEVIKTFIDATVEKYMSWAKVWMECKRNPELSVNAMLKNYNLRKCEELVLNFWCLRMTNKGL
jgi:hypothetical protein